MSADMSADASADAPARINISLSWISEKGTLSLSPHTPNKQS